MRRTENSSRKSRPISVSIHLAGTSHKPPPRSSRRWAHATAHAFLNQAHQVGRRTRVPTIRSVDRASSSSASLNKDAVLAELPRRSAGVRFWTRLSRHLVGVSMTQLDAGFRGAVFLPARVALHRRRFSRKPPEMASTHLCRGVKYATIRRGARVRANPAKAIIRNCQGCPRAAQVFHR